MQRSAPIPLLVSFFELQNTLFFFSRCAFPTLPDLYLAPSESPPCQGLVRAASSVLNCFSGILLSHRLHSTLHCHTRSSVRPLATHPARVQITMRHPSTIGSGPRLCQVCEFASSRQPVRFAKRPFVALQSGERPAKPCQVSAGQPISARLFTSSAQCLKVKRIQAAPPAQSRETSQPRFARAARSSDSQKEDVRHPQQPGTVDLAELAAVVDRVTKAFLAQPGIPSEAMTLVALQACGKINLNILPDVQEKSSEAPESSHLLHLDPIGGATKLPEPTNTPSLRLRDVVDKVSDTAYTIVTHPPVVITPQVLQLYIRLQAKLGKPESLPQVLELYATKPMPRLVSGSIEYSEQNADKLNNAVDSAIVETALDAAIEARNLDVAVGVVESTYATKASRRLRLLSKALLPGTLLAATPVSVYLIASRLSLIQNSMDPTTATNVAFAAILAYVGFTGTIGAVAISTANDQMKRVTWAPGVPLRTRWLRENERAAYDKIACGFGFSEQRRHGEEEGEEFQLLREFILRRGMILDAVELMPGMT